MWTSASAWGCNTLAAMNEGIRPFGVLSLFYYSGGSSPLAQSLAVTDVVVLLGASAVLLVVALALVERRDVRV